MGTLSYTVPSIGSPNATEDPEVAQALIDIKAEYNANIAAMLGAWKPVTSWWIKVAAGLTNATGYYPDSSGVTALAIGTGSTNGIQNAFYLDPADFALTGYTTKVRLRTVLDTGNTAPGVNFTMALNPITAVAGGAGIVMVNTVGAATVSVTRNTPGTNQELTDITTEATMPAAAFYIATIAISGTTAANSNTQISLQLQYRYI